MAARKILIVFYSRSGTTRTVAEALAAELKCDAEEIVATKKLSRPRRHHAIAD